jgi:SAM-dependent methyltransferase
MSRYGTKEWFDRAYHATNGDPWGVAWRPTQRYRHARMLREVAAHGISGDDPLAVDIGCATGEFTSLIHRSLAGRHRARVVGVDLSAIAVGRAAQQFPEVTFRAGSVTDAVREYGGQASLVTCMEAIYYLPSAERLALLDGLRSLLRPGGLVLISAMIGDPPYINREQLLELVGRFFTTVSSGRLSLWPLVSLEKLALKIAGGWFGADTKRVEPGDAGYRSTERWARRMRKAFGSAADSHAYALGRV